MGTNALLERFLGVGDERISTDEAVAYIDEYFSVQENGRPSYSGSHFETLGAGRKSCPFEITPEDLLATSLLSKPVSGQAIVGILGPFSAELSDLLHRLPVDKTFEDLTNEEYRELMGAENSPARRTWDLLRQYENSWDVGPTGASKLLARKRPSLIPVYDSFVAFEAGLSSSRHQWTVWREAFQVTDFVSVLAEIRHRGAGRGLSLLRTLDIVLWMYHRGRVPENETSGLSMSARRTV